ncbi:Sirohydrochlorin cobaltochelatase [BD1-7 clade bacterium]|uniref:Sirohydrochlorin cobaltochelatase n=1 Tax=BD1-7 clade bacterium TaxID=2029982 RepID=A0A5S9PDY7_9GAMM|nr:Sirohydrochlorin cobaltochelatase [BD1-7 clade bacterium]CAA0102185.1 Sirohydrochlorin cobaltochelatase [BD1-7 clade bacterium]
MGDRQVSIIANEKFVGNLMITTDKDKPAILFVGHGSRDVDAVEEFYQLASHFRERFPERIVETGFLEFVRPIIAEGVEKLVEQGVTHIQAIPGMLMAGGHAKNDIPSELNALQAQYGVKIEYGSELGVNPKMMQAARARIEESEKQFGEDYDRKDTLLVVVGRGASDADANSNICKITRFLEEGMGFGWATTCYSGVTTPLVPDALERTYPMGFKNVIVFPYFLFTGRLVKKIYQWSDEFAAAHPDVKVVNAPYLNDHPLVIDTFVEKLGDIEAGNPNMNCQLCQYRVQIVGSEHKVGRVQESHHHHVQGIGTDADHHHHHHDHGHHHHETDDSKA